VAASGRKLGAPFRFDKARDPPGRGNRNHKKSPGTLARASLVYRRALRQAAKAHPTFLKALPKLSFTGSIESVAAFCAIATSSLD
jgi:hypothetical protein